MNFNSKKARRVRNLIISLTIICMTPLCEKGRMLSGAHSVNTLAGQDLICAIDLGNDMFGNHGLETGLNYELMSRFAQDNHCNVKIIAAGRKDNYIDSLRQGKVDIVITHDKDSFACGTFDILRNLDSCSVWAINGDDQQVRQFNRWISHITNTEEYSNIKEKYSHAYNPHRRAERGIQTRTLSPYVRLNNLGESWRNSRTSHF